MSIVLRILAELFFCYNIVNAFLINKTGGNCNMIIIGEKINGSIPSVAEAIANRDADLIKQRAIAQAEANATFIDCCASVPEAEEVETLKWMIDCIQEVTDLPISVDSPSPDVLMEACLLYTSRCV